MSSTKETMKHAGIYSTAAMLGKMVGFLMLPFYAHILRGDGYAVIGMLDAGLALLISLLGYGIRGTVIRLYHDQESPGQQRAVVSTGIHLILAATILLTVPLMVFSRPISALLLDNPDHSRLMVMSLIGLIFEMGGQGAASWLLIRSQSIKFAAVNLFRLIMGLSLNIWLIVILNLGLDGYFISAVVTSVLCNSLLLYYAYRDCGTGFDRPISRQILNFLVPLIPGNLISFASQQAERYLVKFQIDLASVGILEMGYKFPVIIVQFVTTPFMQSWNTRRFEIADQEGADRRIGQMFTYFLFLIVFVGLVMAVVIRPVLVILTPPEFHAAYRIAWAEILTLILSGVYYHLTFGLLYAKHTHTLTLIRGWTSVIKVGLSWWLISTWGIAGAAWSAAVMAAVAAGIGYRTSQRRYRILMEWQKLISVCGLALGMFFLINRWDPADTAVFRLISTKWLVALIDWIASTPLGEWKDGKLPIVLAARAAPLTEVLLKALAAAPYGLILIVVHDGARQRLVNLIRRR